MGVIPTFVFYVVLCSGIMRLLGMARVPERTILSFIYSLSFKYYRTEKTPDLHDVKSGVDAVTGIPVGVLLPDRNRK